MIKRIIVTPTFRPHFPFNREFLGSFAEHVADAGDVPIHFVSTRDEIADLRALLADFPALTVHAHAFEDLLAAAGEPAAPDALLRELGKFAYQSLKKLYALKVLEYDQALVLDSEALVLKPVRVAEVFDEYFADPYILCSDMRHRHTEWFGGLSDAAVRNAARLLRVPYPGMYFMEYYGWFYDRRIVHDLFASFPEGLLAAIRARLRDDTRLFEIQLFYGFILAHRERYPYRFVVVQDLLREYLGDATYAAYMRTFEGNGEQFGVFEMASRAASERNLPGLVRLFNDRRFRFYRFELVNLNEDVQRELIARTPVTFLVSSEGYRRTRERVAVCLSGMPRNPRQNLHFLRSFLDGRDVDVFYHMWESADADYVARVLRPAAHVVEPPSAAPRPPEFKHAEKLIPAKRRPDVTSMFYSMKRANDLKRAYEVEHDFRYDIVVRLRLDFFTTTPLAAVVEHIRDRQDGWDGTLYVPDMAHSSGINDQLALGSSGAMDVYSTVFDVLHEFAETEYFNPEYLVLRRVLNAGLRIRTFPFEYVLLRNDRVATFDLAEHVARTQQTWWSAQLPPIPLDRLNEYFGAKAESVVRVQALDLEFARVFRLKLGTRGYLRYDAAGRKLGFVADAAAAGLFYLIVAGDDDRTAINVRPRELVVGATRARRAAASNFYPDGDGDIRPDGPADDDSAFFLIPRGDGYVFEWRPGFWKTPADPRGVEMRSAGGGRPALTRFPATLRRLALHPSPRGGLMLAPLTPETEPFVVEYVHDPAAEAVELGLDPNASDRVRVLHDPLPLRLWYLSYLAARTVHQRGARAAKGLVSSYIRRRAHRAEQTNARGVLARLTRELAKRV
ncbi:hypothetical protein tb265_36140 [Gemmatimonadetes bacterium T265]|nr:hypothetical protein tb265_36140 [Gemmatimonadetes bacterium T265]